MYFRFLNAPILILLFAGATHASQSRLHVCADPDNLPYSNRASEGFENHIAESLARYLKVQIFYEWQRMGRGFVREYIDKSRCDVLIGVPRGLRGVLTTEPYYRSSYVFVARRQSHRNELTLNSPALRTMKIGVQILEDDYTPPAKALANRGLQTNLVGFYTMGADGESVVRAVAEQKVDVAIVWGPLAGFFARRFGNSLALTPVEPEVDPPGLPLTFEISMGVRKGNEKLRSRLDAFLRERRAAVRELLHHYGVPMLPMAADAGKRGT